MSGSNNFHKHADTAYEWIHELSEEMHIPTEKAARLIRIVLHATRDHIPQNESFHLLAQLPLMWKGIYVDGWKSTQIFERLDGWEGYIQSVRENDKKLSGFDFGNDQQAKKIILSIWKIIHQHITKDEVEHICNTLPAEIRKDIEKLFHTSNI